VSSGNRSAPLLIQIGASYLAGPTRELIPLTPSTKAASGGGRPAGRPSNGTSTIEVSSTNSSRNSAAARLALEAEGAGGVNSAYRGMVLHQAAVFRLRLAPGR